MEQLLTPRQVSDLWGLPYQTVCALMRQQVIESIPIGITATGPKARLATTESRVERFLSRRLAEAQEAREPQRKPLKMPRTTKQNDPPPGMEYGPNGKLRIKRK